MTTEIPKEAVYVCHSMKLHTVNEWFCPNCGARGDDKTLDCVPDLSWDWKDNEFAWATYCCGECFEYGIYVTFNK